MVKVPVSELRKVMIGAAEAKILKGQVIILNERIANLQELVKQTELKDSIAVAGLNANINSLLQEKALYQDQIKSYERLLKIEKRKRTLTGLVGILVSVGAFMIGQGK